VILYIVRCVMNGFRMMPSIFMSYK
jgi:hypothetical protein